MKSIERQDSKGDLDGTGERHLKEKRLTSEKIEDKNIREKLKLQSRKETAKKGPLLAKPAQVTGRRPVGHVQPKIPPGVVPRYQRGKHLSPNNGESAFTRHIVNSNPSSRNTSPNTSRKTKPASPVNPTRIPQPTVPPPGEKKGGSRPSPSPSPLDNAVVSLEATGKRVEKVKRARLYLLQQMGPNSFLIGGDSPNHKYRVIIGPQKCSCGKGPDCVHVLFVMLRVFQIRETDPKLWSKTLKNYEVESLFRNYHARRTKKLSELYEKPRSGGKAEHKETEDPGAEPGKGDGDKEQDMGAEEHSQPKDDEDNCPICLLDMVEGESLVQCVDGCHNRLHHHCIDIWFQNCRRQHETFTCPLCRVMWPSENLLEDSSGREELPAPPNTRSASPVPPHPEPDINQLPRVEPIADEFRDTAKPWIQHFGEPLVACIFSRQWTDRETSLKHLSRATQTVLLQAIHDPSHHLQISDTSGVDGQTVSLEAAAAEADTDDGEDETQHVVTRAHQAFDCCCAIVAFMCKDPVYKVYVAALKCLRTVLAFTVCRSEGDRQRVEEALRPVVESILIKCAESNNPGLLSISALQELMKGQEGELALGREIDNPGEQGLDGIEYVLSCITQDYDPSEVQWQWLLGRLYILDNLLEEYPREFMVSSDKTGELDLEPPTNFTRVMGLLKFCAPVLSFSHSKVEKIARRIFYLTARLQIHNHAVLKEILNFLNDTDSTIRKSMKRRLLKLQEEYHLSHQSQASKEGAGNQCIFATEIYEEFDPIFTTPVVSGATTPSSLSPVPSDSTGSELGVHLTSSDPQVLLLAPPNSPRKPRDRLTKSLNRLKEVQAEVHAEDSVDGRSSPLLTGEFSTTIKTGLHQRLPKSLQIESCHGVLTPPLTPLRHSDHLGIQESQEITSEGTSLGGFPVQFTDAPARTIPKIQVPGITPLGHPDREGSPYLPQFTDNEPHHEYHHLDIYQKNVDSDHEDLISFSPELAYDTEDGDSVPPADSPEHLAFSESYPRGDTLLIRDLPETSSSSRDYEDSVSEGEAISVPTSDSGSQGVVSVDSKESTGKSVLSLVVGDEEFSENEAKVKDGGDAETALSQSYISNEESENIKDEVEKGEVEAEAERVDNEDINKATSSPQERSGPSHQGTMESMLGRESSLSDDYSDLLSPKREKGRVSFKTEVANSPQHTPQVSPEHNSPEVTLDCQCKEEVEREEAQALVAAMEQSTGDQATLPFVPGLSPEEDQTLTIHVQQESVDGLPEPMHSYEESVHWVRGGMLGTGAFSTCYQARDIKTGTLMCVKQISFCRNSQSEQEKVIEAVREEIQMMSKLNHPNIVRILGATQQGCHFFMFVEWMPGGSVAFLLDMYGAFSEQVIVSYTQQMLRGLAYLHENHMLHRDLKGANLLVDSTGQRLRIGDFGAASRLASKTTGAGEFQGQLLGTIAFMAPEVLRGESYGRSCDIWSLGCVLIEMFTTKPPWGASGVSNHLALIFKIASAVEAPPIPENMPPGLKDLVLRCLEVNREERPPARDLIKHPALTMFKR